jgi:hypothetical protein
MERTKARSWVGAKTAASVITCAAIRYTSPATSRLANTAAASGRRPARPYVTPAKATMLTRAKGRPATVLAAWYAPGRYSPAAASAPKYDLSAWVADM